MDKNMFWLCFQILIFLMRKQVFAYVSNKGASLSIFTADHDPFCTIHNMSHVVRKPAFYICKNKAAHQLRINCLFSLHR